jgi:hypothetical protein
MAHASVTHGGSKDTAWRLVIEGYGSPDLIDRLRASTWVPCLPSGRNFAGLALGEMVFADRPDPLCQDKYQISVETVPPGDAFTVEGYQTAHLFDSLRMSAQPCTVAGSILREEAVGDVTAYRVTVERLAGAAKAVARARQANESRWTESVAGRVQHPTAVRAARYATAAGHWREPSANRA